jgi:UDP-N-acetylmuramoyl-tripeptide--D-alanyl-D-alanine ligase
VRWTARELAEQAGGRLLRPGSRSIASAFIDSRAPVTDGLFVPIVAARDGHDFIDAAVQGGAAAVLVRVGHPAPEGDVTVVEVGDTLAALGTLARARRASLPAPVVSISGSNGKTTTRAMVAAVLRAGFDPVLCTTGNLNNHLGVPLTMLGTPHDPAATVVELGMNAPGENDHLASLVRPTIHVITSVALEHLEFMKTIEAIAAAEAEPVRHVVQGGVVVVPSDEPLLGPHLRGARVLRCGPDADADVRVLEVETSTTTRALLRPRSLDAVDVRLKLFGAHNARNAAAAMAIGVHLGLPMHDIVAALESVEPVGDRSRVTSSGPHLLVADCYNANPGSVSAALRSLASLRATRSGPLVAVLGDMLELGPREDALHAEMGALAGELGVDALVGIGPRSRHTVEAARARGVEAAHFDADAIAEAVAWVQDRIDADPGAVLVKGSRGMKLERFVQALTG